MMELMKPMREAPYSSVCSRRARSHDEEYWLTDLLKEAKIRMSVMFPLKYQTTSTLKRKRKCETAALVNLSSLASSIALSIVQQDRIQIRTGSPLTNSLLHDEASLSRPWRKSTQGDPRECSERVGVAQNTRENKKHDRVDSGSTRAYYETLHRGRLLLLRPLQREA